MKIFISWSGHRSWLVADALREWVKDVIQSVDCFCSSEDIRAGQRWASEVSAWLADTDFGILCVTPENMNAPWLNFEAGALAKRVDDARVVPVTLGFQPAALEEPLKQFNGVAADKQGILKLMRSIAEVAQPGLDIEKTFDRWWSDLEQRLNAIPESSETVTQPEPPDVSELFSDIMSAIRGLSTDLRRDFLPQPLVTSGLWSEHSQQLSRTKKFRNDNSADHAPTSDFLRTLMESTFSGSATSADMSRGAFREALIEATREATEQHIAREAAARAEVLFEAAQEAAAHEAEREAERDPE